MRKSSWWVFVLRRLILNKYLLKPYPGIQPLHAKQSQQKENTFIPYLPLFFLSISSCLSLPLCFCHLLWYWRIKSTRAKKKKKNPQHIALCDCELLCLSIFISKCSILFVCMAGHSVLLWQKHKNTRQWWTQRRPTEKYKTVVLLSRAPDNYL